MSSASPTTATDVGAPSNTNECGIPADWTSLNRDFPAPALELVVLEWRQRSDKRPLFIDEAFVWFRGDADAGAYWFLATLYRHPKEENQWRIAIVADAPIVPLKLFDHAPSNADVDAFLKDTTWRDRNDSFEQTGGRRCNDAWTRVIGARPL